jgi:hypothetical protein
MSRRSRRSSTGKKVFLTIFVIVAALVVIAAGVGAKLYFDLSGSIKQTYESTSRFKQKRAI